MQNILVFTVDSTVVKIRLSNRRQAWQSSKFTVKKCKGDMFKTVQIEFYQISLNTEKTDDNE